MMKQKLTLKWLKIIPKPDPIYGIPVPRSSHGVSLLRNDIQQTTKLLVYGGEHIARTPIDNEASAIWICDLTNVPSLLVPPTISTSTVPPPSSSSSSSSTKEDETTVVESKDEAIWKRINTVSISTINSSNSSNDNVASAPSSSSMNFPPARIAHAQAVYQNRYVYIFGGRSSITMNEQPMNDLWVLDTMAMKSSDDKPGSNEDDNEQNYVWSPVQVDVEHSDTAPEPRSYHRMICIKDALYVFGGCGTEGRLNDLYKFDIIHRTWHNLGNSTKLRGRGGTNLISLANQTQIAVVCGFAGQEMNDGHIYDISQQRWDRMPLTPKLDGVRPRSVCVSASFPKNGIAIVFGGEVNPSDRGHVGAGSFASDIVVLDEQMGFHVVTIPSPDEKRQEKILLSNDQMGDTKHQWHDRYVIKDVNYEKYQQPWPTERGWADCDYYEDNTTGVGYMYMFGGLSGNDDKPIRLNDLWKFEVCHM